MYDSKNWGYYLGFDIFVALIFYIFDK